MTDLVVSVFHVYNRRGYAVPFLDLGYQERGADIDWRLVTGGTRAYVIRAGGSLSENLEEQSADSHFMIRRVTSALLLGRRGLFRAEPAGRFMMHDVGKEFAWTVHLDKPEPSPEVQKEDVSAVEDWYLALATHTLLRRAADDLYLALANPHDAFVFIYRGIEWLKQGLSLSWDEFAQLVDIPLRDLKELTKMANVETGVRHASKSGSKMRPDTPIYGTWACAVVDSINAVRAKLESTFQPMTPTSSRVAVRRCTQQTVRRRAVHNLARWVVGRTEAAVARATRA